MPRKSRTASLSPSSQPRKRKSPAIPEPFQMVSSATIASPDATKIKVPMLILYGEWLKAVGFPIGSAAYVTTDAHGEVALSRLGLERTRRVYIRKAPG